MAARASVRYVGQPARKARQVVDLIRGRSVDEALAMVRGIPRAISPVIERLLQSAVANAAEQPDVDVDRLYVARAYVDEGPTMKRYRPRAMGRVARIKKRSCHITVELAEAPADASARAGKGKARRK